MGKSIIRYAIWFVILILLQLVVFNNLQLSGYINPYIYVMFILILPYEISGWLLLIIGFLTGLTVDTFMNTFGMHSSATLLMAFLRPYVLTLFTDREDINPKGSPSMGINGFVWFLKYSIALIFMHHLSLFFIESFTFTNFFHTLWRVILSTLITTIFILIGQLLTVKK
ncbi:MAG: rod shape-determining protein MreD [Bacteroidales bacterium]|jgi:rod shape-determining protein MreD|nr:rod shape-determining protein MreD [Bacteroidales bacterium]MDD4384428.1 rod shape-determining protein MreD [Bacteroidales bacterium]MDY0196605.1 rod shape-determining protein MreD [Tenuifilaceae bacterium]